MIVYRIAVKFTHPEFHTSKFVSPRIFLFHPLRCAKQYEQEFISRCKLLFIAQDSKWNDGRIEHTVEYQQYIFHPFRDIWNRITNCFHKG